MGINIDNVRVPSPAAGEDYVMECEMVAEESAGEFSRSVSFRGYATRDVVGRFIDIAACVAGVTYIVHPNKEESDG